MTSFVVAVWLTKIGAGVEVEIVISFLVAVWLMITGAGVEVSTVISLDEAV